MQKKYIVRLTDQERNELVEVVRQLKGTGQKVRRAWILLKRHDGETAHSLGGLEGLADALR
jgi:hypothetical protein